MSAKDVELAALRALATTAANEVPGLAGTIAQQVLRIGADLLEHEPDPATALADLLEQHAQRMARLRTWRG